MNPIVLVPIIETAVGKFVNRNKGKSIHGTEMSKELTKELVKEISTNPVMVNETNSEKPYQSRVGVGGSAVIIGSLGVVLQELSSKSFPNYDWVVLGPALVTLWGGIYTLYGRFWSGLRPLFTKKVKETT